MGWDLWFFQKTQESRCFVNLPIVAPLCKETLSKKNKTVLPVRFRPQVPVCQVWAHRLAAQQSSTCLMLIQVKIKNTCLQVQGCGNHAMIQGHWLQRSQVHHICLQCQSDRAAESTDLFHPMIPRFWTQESLRDSPNPDAQVSPSPGSPVSSKVCQPLH